MESISPWTVYWIMQLDALRAVIGVCCFVFGGSTAAMLIIGSINYFDSIVGDLEKGKEMLRFCRRFLVPPFLIFMVASALLPSTKSACAILAIPVIANNETLQADATEVYSLGMERLKEALEIEDNTDSTP